MQELLKEGTFEWALLHMKGGQHLARRGWDAARVEGLDLFVFHQPGYPAGIPINANTAKGLGLAEGVYVKFKPYLQMCRIEKTNGDDNRSCVHYTASQVDLLAEDWYIKGL